MAREGLRAGQVSFFLGVKTTAEIAALLPADLQAGDMVYNSTTKSLLVYDPASAAFLEPNAKWVV